VRRSTVAVCCCCCLDARSQLYSGERAPRKQSEQAGSGPAMSDGRTHSLGLLRCSSVNCTPLSAAAAVAKLNAEACGACSRFFFSDGLGCGRRPCIERSAGQRLQDAATVPTQVRSGADGRVGLGRA